jgi:hypothetical protein
MRRTSLITILVFVAGLGIGYIAREAVGTLLQRYTHKADLTAIEKAHQEDIEATLTQDLKRLMDEWAEERWPSIREARLRSASRPLGL